MTDRKDNPYAHIADDTFAAAPRRDPELVKRILEDPRMHDHKDGFQSCIQCGVCTSGCPAARFTEYSPRETARRALDGDVDACSRTTTSGTATTATPARAAARATTASP